MVSARRFSRLPLRLSPSANLLWPLRRSQLEAAHWRAREALRNHEPERTPYQLTGPRIESGDDEELYDHLAGIWKRSSLQMAQPCRPNGIDYYHFLQPNQYVAGSKRAGEPRSIYGDDCCHYNALGREILATRIADLILGDSSGRTLISRRRS